MGIYNEIHKRIEKEKLSKSKIIKIIQNKNLNNNQNYIISYKKRKNISKKLLKLFYFGFTDNKKKLSDYGSIQKLDVPFFSAKILFFGIFIFFFTLLLYLLITEFSIGLLLGFIFILFWGFLVFNIPQFQEKFNVKCIYDKDKYIYYFYKDKEKNIKINYLNGLIKISYDKTKK